MVSSDFQQDGDLIFDGSPSTEPRKLSIKANGDKCKRFTLENMAFSIEFGSPVTFSAFQVTLRDEFGNVKHTHSVAAGALIFQPGVTMKLNELPFTEGWPAAGYLGVAGIDVTWDIDNGGASELLNFNSISMKNIYPGDGVPLGASISTQTNVSCYGGSNGAATVTASGGAGGYSYSWSPSGGTAATATGLSAGTYTVTVTDAANATTTADVTISQPTALAATTSSNDVSCYGGSNGLATVIVTGGTAPYTYSWSPAGGAGATASGLSAGTYTVTVTDNNFCQITKTIIINQPPLLTATVTSAIDATTFRGSNGSASVSVSGGTAPYSYSWSPSGGTAATATNLSAGTYTITITDAISCNTTTTVTISEPVGISKVDVPVAGTYKAGSQLNFTLNFSGPVTVAGSPYLPVTVGSASKKAIYNSGSGTNTLVFTYTVSSGDEDTNGIALAAAVNLNGGSFGPADNTLYLVGNTNGILVDGIVPNTTIVSQPPALTNSTSATFEFSGTEPGTFEGSIDGTVYTAVTSPWTLSGLSEGNHTFSVRATDIAENMDPTPASYSWVVDVTPPPATSAPVLSAGSDSGVSGSDNITNITTPTVTGTADAGAMVVRLYDGATEIGNTTVAGDGKWTVTPSALVAGTHTLTAKATDAAGNTSAASTALTLTVDDIAPTVTIGSNLSSLKAGETASIIFTFSEDPGTTFSWDGSAGDIVVSGGTLSAISGSGTTRTATFTPDADANGTASITVGFGKYTDAAGNNGGAGATPSITFDSKAPTLAITSDKSALKAGETATITFTFNEDPESSFNLADVSVTGGTLSSLSGAGLTRTATFTPIVNTDVGSSSIKVNAGTYTDPAGNPGGAGAALVITYDTKAPAAPSKPDLANTSDSGISNTDDLTNVTTATFTGTAGDGEIVRLYNGATLVGTATATGGVWTITTSVLNEGTHSITAVATDAAGNTGSASTSVVITVDTSAPSAPVVAAPANGATVITLTPIISGTAELNSTVMVYVDGAVSSSVAVGAGGSWTYTPPALANGSRTVSATATDMAGNTSVLSTVNTFTVDTTPTISASGTLTTFTTTYGTASASQNFSVSATNLAAGILVTPPSGFEVSADNTTFSITVTIGAAGNLPATPVYVRLKEKSPAGNHTGNISLTSAGATAVNVATHATNTVNKAALIITATGNNRQYNGGTAATVTLTDNRISGDVLTASYTAATFNNKTVGTAKAVSVSGISITGADAGNYTFNNTATTTADIKAKALTVSATGIHREYDGGTAATVNLTDDRASGDVLMLAYTTAAFDNKNAGTVKPVSVSGISVTGADAGNYTYNTAATTTAVITAKALTITATSNDKVYDGNDLATVTLHDDRVTGDAVTLTYTAATFSDKHTGTGKAISVSGISISGTDAGNYTYNKVVTTTGNITAKAVTVTALEQTKMYGKSDPALTFTVSPVLIAGDTFTGALGRTRGENAGTYAIGLNTLALSANYALTFHGSALTVTKAPLVITADNKQKFAGTSNPPLTVSYSGFVTGEDALVLSQSPVISTTATTASPLGDYPIMASGAAADNYAITYVDGTLKVVPGAPTSVSLAGVTLHENRPAGTAAGTLSSTSEDPNAVFTYSFVSGSGDTDNSLFTIAGNQLKTASSLNFEQKNNYSIRVRSTTQHGFSLDQVFTVSLSDVNEAPTLAAIAEETICYTTAPMTVQMSGATAGPETAQVISYALSSDNDDLFEQLTINNNGRLTYQVKNGRSGTANVTVTVTDNGGTANGGVDTFSRTFVITVNSLPVITIASDKGNSISKGDVVRLTATGGATYSWTNPGGIVSGQQSATVTFRPEKTATYRVTVKTAAGCVSEHEITIEVKEDYVTLNQTNVVTPNGDGVNDNFVIKNIDMYPNNTVKIFDNAGRLLYSKANYTSEWDGTFQGSPLAEGTYYYIVDFGNGKPVLKGFITIVRD